MIYRCLSCNTATNVSLQRGVKITDYRCYCGGILKKAMVTYLDGHHTADPSKTRIGECGDKKGLPYFLAYNSDNKLFYKTGDKFIEILTKK